MAAMQLARGWLKLGYRVDYVTSAYAGLVDEEIVDGINVYRVTAWGRKERATATLPTMFCYVVFATLKGIRLCRRNRYSFINTHFVIPCGPVGWILGTLFRLPNVLSIHGGDIYDPSKKLSPHRHALLRVLVRSLLRAATVVIAQSSNTRDNAHNYFARDVQISIVPLAYEPASFTPRSRGDLGLAEDAYWLVTTGRLIKRKGYSYLIDALARLPEDIHLVFIGDGPLRSELEAQAQRLGVAKRVRWEGYVTEERKFQVLNVCDCYVLSSLHEGFGIVLQEAMQVGLPIVATNHGGQVDLVSEGVNGVLVQPEDPEQIATAVQHLHGNRVASKEMGEAGREIISKFESAHIASDYMEALVSSYD
ncbi:glycosyltransferase family 4 protein [Gammaproteobacteria bacterium]|nr:glycosyltransferase family 4 protein [Gammaproteobacteria bacterium]